MRRTFRRQHLEKFLPGLEKLGLRGLPDAVACAQYHYLSNALGGVKVEWIAESDTKSWVRYLPPRWIWDGVAVCAVPTEVNRAMLWGWHAHNGVTLGNDRLGFVATSLTTDGGVGLVGYYVEEDRPLALEERLRFSPGSSHRDRRASSRRCRGTPSDWPRSSATTRWTTSARSCPSCAPCWAWPTPPTSVTSPGARSGCSTTTMWSPGSPWLTPRSSTSWSG